MTTALDRNGARDGAQLSRGLGWFGIALGVAELAAPRLLARAIGLKPDRRVSWIVRALGAREVIASLAILLRPRRPGAVWARVVGDVVDAALLGTALATRARARSRVAGALAAVAGAGVLDTIASTRVTRAFAAAHSPVTFAVTIAKPPQEVYDFYRRLENLPTFMDYLESVRETGPAQSHWVARLPIGGTVSWDAEIVEDVPGEHIAWRSREGSTIETRGTVWFARAPGRDSTEVRVEMQLGAFGIGPTSGLARWFAKPQMKGDLRRLKQVLETGEVLRSDASIHRAPHPAQPTKEER